AAGALAEAGGGAVQSVFRSKKVRAKDIISPLESAKAEERKRGALPCGIRGLVEQTFEPVFGRRMYPTRGLKL
ncbi:MAG: hypothetical protein Greene041679_326, partial [Parcubacteria group bacterium Greene0416_79]